MRRRGLTLAEVVVALGLFSLIALSIMGLLLSARSASSAGAESATAVAIAQEQLDVVRTLPNATLVGNVTQAIPDSTVVQGDRSYQVHVVVAHLDSDPAAVGYPLLDVSVRVQWQQSQAFGRTGASQVTRSLVEHSVVSPLVNY